MKPEHFRKTKPLGSCGECAYRLWILDQEKHICRKHAFTLINTMAHIMNDHVCDDFAIVAKTKRKAVLDILGDDEYRGHPYTLVIENSWIYALRGGHKGVPKTVRGNITGNDGGGMNYEIEFQATDVWVEDV